MGKITVNESYLNKRCQILWKFQSEPYTFGNFSQSPIFLEISVRALYFWKFQSEPYIFHMFSCITVTLLRTDRTELR